MDLPRHFVIREGDLRILNPLSPDKLATLGAAIKLRPGDRLLDLCCGKGEMLCTWSRDHGIIGTGVDISTDFLAAAKARAQELGTEITFEHADASNYTSVEKADVVSCIGATWIGEGVPGTLEIAERSLRNGGLVLIGEPFRKGYPPVEYDMAYEYIQLPELIKQVKGLGWDVVEMVLANQDDWDRYAAAHWLNIRRWLDANPDDPLVPQMRAELESDPVHHVKYQREYLGWGVFALMKRSSLTQ
jgi:SAM-dependent methyltransferase